MRRTIQVLCAWLAIACVTTSCLGSSDNEVTVYDDMAITAFTLGTLNIYLHKTSSTGGDSIYKTTFAGSGYTMSIDQVKHEIYNRDSLPVGTDAGHVICTITTRNNGIALIESATNSDSLTYYYSTDSIDFSKPRYLRIYSSDGMGFARYKVTLNVRQVENGTLLWQSMPAGTQLPTTPMAGWQFKLGETGDALYSSHDNGATWTAGTFDTDTRLLPTANASFACWTLKNGMDYALLVGDNAQQDSAAVVWRKLIDTEKDNDWVYMPLATGNQHYLPKGNYYWLLPFADDSVLAIGHEGTIYRSRDQGITWKTSSQLTAPTGIGTVAAAVTDGNNGIWLQNTDGQTWYGVMTE